AQSGPERVLVPLLGARNRRVHHDPGTRRARGCGVDRMRTSRAVPGCGRGAFARLPLAGRELAGREKEADQSSALHKGPPGSPRDTRLGACFSKEGIRTRNTSTEPPRSLSKRAYLPSWLSAAFGNAS